jgi:hypothetical protein
MAPEPIEPPLSEAVPRPVSLRSRTVVLFFVPAALAVLVGVFFAVVPISGARKVDPGFRWKSSRAKQKARKLSLPGPLNFQLRTSNFSEAS